MSHFRLVRSLLDRMVQYGACVYWSLILSDEDAIKLAKEKDQAEKK